VTDLASRSPKRLRHTGEWPVPTPRRAPPGSALRALQDAMPMCDGGVSPVLSGDGSERAMLIGQAPGRREIEAGLPFAGDAGKRLAGWLAAARISIDDFRQHWYVTSVGKCYPGRAPGSSVDRHPSGAEVARWTPFLREELRLVAPDLVVLVGGLAHGFAFGRTARLDQLVGRDLSWSDAPGASVLCLPHPSGASTWLNDPARTELWRAGIALLAARWARLAA
jgi:uracil-DNA glycosylase family 4